MRHKGYMKQVPHYGLTYLKHHYEAIKQGLFWVKTQLSYVVIFI